MFYLDGNKRIVLDQLWQPLRNEPRLIGDGGVPLKLRFELLLLPEGERAVEGFGHEPIKGTKL